MPNNSTPWLLKMVALKLCLVDLRGNARYHVAIVPNDRRNG